MKQRLLGAIARGLRAPLRALAHARDPALPAARELERQGIVVYQRHYYHPFVTAADLLHPLGAERELPGIALDAEAQLAFLAGLSGREEIREIGQGGTDPSGYSYAARNYRHGDADTLYAIVRSFRPRRIVEIGAGASTRVIRAALARIRAEDPGHACRHVCVEPYEQPWLEELDVELLRARVETLGPDLFRELGAGDILFIDSSHVVRPQGDVLFEILRVLPVLAPGVLVHVHDIFTPADYPAEWVLRRGLLWNEQYLLEAFLSMNPGYEILLACNWLANRHGDRLQALLPGLALAPDAQPGAFWIRRVGAGG